MRLAINGASTMTSGLRTDIASASAGGFKYLEIWAAKMDSYLQANSISDLKELFRQKGVEPASINSIEFITFRDADYEKVRARCQELCARAQSLGCPYIVVVPSPTPSRETTWEEIKAESVKALRDLGEIAAPYGVGLAFEPLGFGWCSVRTLRAAWEIVQEAGRDNLGVVLDACHFYGGGSEMKEIEALDPARLFIFHLDDVEDGPKESITDARRLLPGRGVLPLDEICARVQKTGFDGLISVELFRPEYWAWPPEELARQARESAIQVLKPYFQED
ncbi:MAG: sugar phosphate isomerase/epimerase family protein [Anaerolineae bacterium]